MQHSPKLKIAPNESDHRIGVLKAPVTIVEYGDFESPQCAAAAVIFDELISTYKSDLCFIYRHFPLSSLHRMAAAAAIAVEAADQQLNFWGMHRLLYQNQIILSPETIDIIAVTLALDMETFNKDLRRTEFAERVQKDFSSGVRSGVNGTPSVYLNGTRYNGEITFAALKNAIDNMLKSTSEFELFY